MSFYDPSSHYSIYDLIDALNRRSQPQYPQSYQQQYGYPQYPRYRRRPQQQQQPYYYFNLPRNEERLLNEEDEIDEDEDGEGEEEEVELDPRGVLYRSMYGDGPYRPVRPSRPVHSSRPSSQPSAERISTQRPAIRRQPSLPRAPHPAESVIDLLNLFGANIPYPQDELPTVKTFEHDSPIGSDSNETKKPTVLQSEENSTSEEESSKSTLAPSAKRPSINPISNRNIGSTLNLHASAPSPKLDPLQVSKPQLSKNLPFSPPINVYDTPTSYLVVVSIPGSDKDSFHVDFHPTSHDLIVKGEVKNKYHDVDSSTDKYIKVSEQRFGSFERNIKFPTLPEIDDEGIKAVYNNGLLEITIPKVIKSQEPKTKRRITIEEVEDEELKREEIGGI